MECLNVRDFFDKYELVRDLGCENFKEVPINRRCRFCKKTMKETSFKTSSHMVPELLGKNSYLSFDECDDCNQRFSKYENSLSIFIRPYITVMGIPTKKGVPSFQSRSINRDESSRTYFSVDREGNRSLVIGHKDDIKVDKREKTFSIRFRRPAYRQSDVYRTLLKIGISIIPEEYLSQYEESINWLLNKPATVSRIQLVVVTVLTTASFGSPNVFLYKKKNQFGENEKMPEFTLVIGTANLVLQIFLPFCKPEKIGGKPIATIFPSIGYETRISETRAKTFFKDLLNNETVEEDEWLTFYSSTILKTPWDNTNG